MIALFDRVGDAFESSRWMIELARDFDSQLRMTRHGVIVYRNAAIGCDELTAFGEHQRIDFQRPRFHAARGGKQISNRLSESLRVRWRKSARTGSFIHDRVKRPAIDITGDASRQGGAFFNPASPACGEDDHWRAGGVINCKRKKKLPVDVDLFLNKHGFDRKLPDFHR